MSELRRRDVAGSADRVSGAVRLARKSAGAAACLIAMGLLQGGSCRKSTPPPLPSPSSAEYPKATRSFFVGMAALIAGDMDTASRELTETTRLAPGEPAGWADLAIIELRGTRIDEALKHIQQARDLAPENADIIYLHGVAKNRKGDFAGAETDFRTVIQKQPNNLRARFALVDQIQQTGGPNADEQSLKLLQEMSAVAPNNLLVLLETLRVAGKQADAHASAEAIDRLAASTFGWGPEHKSFLPTLRAQASKGDYRGLGITLIGLHNLLKSIPRFSIDYAQARTPTGVLGEPITRLIKLPNPPATIAASDDALTFTPAPHAAGAGASRSAAFFYAGLGAKPVLLASGDVGAFVGGSTQTILYPGGSTASSEVIVRAADLNSDFKTDVILAGPKGLRIFQQAEDGSFSDATSALKTPSRFISGSIRNVWTADVDVDGDLDVIVAPTAGPLTVLRNNGDNSLHDPQPPGMGATLSPFATSAPSNGKSQLPVAGASVADFGWGDLDEDGDPDAVMLDASGGVSVFRNERSSYFERSPLPETVKPAVAFTMVDSDEDGQLDLVVLKRDGGIVRVARDLTSLDRDAWKTSDVGRWDGASGLKPGGASLFSADLDNNGGIDLIASSGAETRVWLHGPGSVYKPLAAALPARCFAAADTDGDGRLDLAGIAADRKPAVFLNHGQKSYAWQEINPRAEKTEGDQRINTFGIGGSMEIRSGFVTQRQPIASPVVHFGLGERANVDVTRIFWPNGLTQVEFPKKVNESVSVLQRLKGSCPWMFAWDGKRMAFVTDTLWRSPLGLRINAQDTGKVVMTEEWVRIPGDRLVPRDGAYDIRITAELWETHFFDHVSLLSVDHPVGTEIWVDERFSIPPPRNAFILTKPSVPVSRATDDAGVDVTAAVRELDGNYLDTFGRGYYQGVTRDHYVEVDLRGAPDVGVLYLIGQGWIHPTDSSINVALGQGTRAKPQDLSLEIPDGRGGWKVARPHLGFPAGKNKSIVLDITGLFAPGQPKRLRLRTNLEIYWDRLSWAGGADAASRRVVKTKRSLPESADLSFRGYSATHTANASSPEIPDYEALSGTAPRWCDLVGYYTRFGGVGELLKSVDDRYVIMNAGDEMRFRFPVQPVPSSGLKRDFIVISDGWEKDGDFNTGFSKTVLPLPSHANPAYNTAPTTLEKDPVYRRYPRDWQTYHTRYVTPEGYWAALRTKSSMERQ